MSIDNIKVGDHVRLNCTVYDTVVINRIAEIFDNTILTENDGSMYQGEYSKEEIIKSSSNIIDLIEEKDIITYEYETSIGKIIEYNVTVLLSLLNELEENPNKYKIKSIITHEQIETMEYKI